MAKLHCRKSAGKTFIHAAACLWGESSDVLLTVLYRTVSPCTRVSPFLAFEARSRFLCFWALEIHRCSLILISLKLSLQYFVDCEVTMMQDGALLIIDMAVEGSVLFVYERKNPHLMWLHGFLIKYSQILFEIFEYLDWNRWYWPLHLFRECVLNSFTLSGLVFFRFCQSVYLLYDLFDSVTTLPHHIVKMVEVLHFAEVTWVWVWTRGFMPIIPGGWGCFVFFTWPV